MDCFATLAMTAKLHEFVMPAKADIQYAAAYRFNHWRLWNTQCAIAHKAGDDD
jgi:hypothetical protein